MKEIRIRSLCSPVSLPLLLLAAALCARAAGPVPPEEEAIQLNPFEVRADSSTSYDALNSRSVTSFNAELSKVPVSADILDRAFINDVGALSVEDLLAHSAGAGIGPLGASSAYQSQPGDRVNLSYIQLRGLQTPNMQRDSLLFVGTLGGPGGTGVGHTDDFDIERVETIFGPQALLYDGGGAGGVVNLVTKEARLGGHVSGSVTFRTDQYGTKYGLFDYGAGTDRFAVRVAIVDGTNDTRRINIGHHIAGQYVQVAGRLGATVVRLSVEQTRDAREVPDYVSVNTAGDGAATPYGQPYSAYSGYKPGFLLATRQAGAFDNGEINWSNVNSYEGWIQGDSTVAGFATIEADSQWTDWFATQLSAGISEFTNDHFFEPGGIALYSPGATANPIPGNWTMGMTGKFSATDSVRPYHGQGLRGTLLFTNSLFGGKAKSQTAVGADLVDNRGGIISYGYFQADGNGNVLTTGPAGTNLGRIILPKLAWSVNRGVVEYPFFRPGAQRVTYGGVNYVRAMLDPFNKGLVSPANPLGTSIVNGQNGLRNDAINDGVYGTNYSQWLDGKLDTLFGVRLEHAYTYTARPQLNPPSLTPNEIIESHNANFSLGADYRINGWLTPYFLAADSYLVPPDLQNDPYGNPLRVAHAMSVEAGLKIGSPSGNLSGQLAVYHSAARNQEFLMTSSLGNDINPAGLNGRYDSDATTGYSADVESDGAQLTLTATPTRNWRARLSAAVTSGRIQSSSVYPTLYNDQFHENAQGQVTYADGTVVYVAPAYSSKTPAYTASNAPAGSVPLTVTKLSTPADIYFAGPQPVTGQILASSAAAKVLQAVDPSHGAILTGATGLPIASYQLNPALSGVTPVRTIAVALAGDRTTGYPEYALDFTNVYTFSSGWLKGLFLGGNAALSWRKASYYYYPSGLTAAGPAGARNAFTLPTSVQLNPIVGYTRRFGRVTFTTQLNIYNLFNHYSADLFPDPISGWSAPTAVQANFDGQPRIYAWTNSITF